jgi:superoxide dismutase, Fe-Mn family
MKQFEAKTFNIPELKGISAKNIEEHMKLYQGYVKHVNLINSMIEMYGKVDDEGGKYSLSEITRRFSFEFNGMRNHEYYFAALENGAKEIDTNGDLAKAIEEEFGSFGVWLTRFKTIALTRGVGWAMLYWDPVSERLVNAWIDEQHLGQLNGCKVILALDMWEHSFVYDYQPSGKKQYVEDFFANLNWSVIEENFASK